MARIYYGSILIMLAVFTLIQTGNNVNKLGFSKHIYMTY